MPPSMKSLHCFMHRHHKSIWGRDAFHRVREGDDPSPMADAVERVPTRLRAFLPLLLGRGENSPKNFAQGTPEQRRSRRGNEAETVLLAQNPPRYLGGYDQVHGEGRGEESS